MTDRRRNHRILPSVERVESRLLLSDSTIAFSRPAHAQVAQSFRSELTPANGQGIQGDATDFLAPTGTPTPHEAAREKFSAAFTGTYVFGGGRFSSQSHSLTFRGAGRGSYFLHGDAQLGTVTPKDTTRPISGLLTMFDRNINTNFVYGLDLAGSQVTGVDKHGRPTHLTYTTDVNVSSGITVESLSQGTITIKYLTTGGASRGIDSQGAATILVKGRVYTLGSSQILKNAGINP